MKRSNIIIVIVLHALIIGFLGFYASREGMLGEKMKTLSVALIPKPKVEEPVKPKVEPVVSPTIPVPQPTPQITHSEPPPASLPVIAPPVAPPLAELPAISFSDGAKDVVTSSDPIQLYKSYIEQYLRSQWNMPESGDGVAQLEISIDMDGRILSHKLLTESGKEWGSSATVVFSKLTRFPQPPPNGFPKKFQIRFDTIESF